MKAQGIFISAMLVIDTFLISFAAGFNSQHVLVVDPALAPRATPPGQKEIRSPDKPSESAEKGALAGDSKAKGKEAGETKRRKGQHVLKKKMVHPTESSGTPRPEPHEH